MVNNVEIPEWIKETKKNSLAFIERLKYTGPYGRFRYSVEGCILHHEPISSCYAFGILNAINGYKQLGDEKKKEWADYLRSFQE